MNTAKLKQILIKILLYFLLILVAVYTAFPFYWSLITSFKTTEEVLRYPATFFPETFTWDNYINLFQDMPWFSYIGNTLITTFAITFGNMFFGCLSAYAFAKFKFRGKNILLQVFYFSMMMPGIVMLIPQFIVTMTLGLLDSLFGVILPGCVGVYSMLFIRQFLLSTPKEIGEAAEIDGAGRFLVFTMYLRMILPGVATLGLFSFNGAWNAYLWPSIVLMDERVWVLSIALKNYSAYYTDNFGPLMAASIIVIIPVLILFLITQKFFVNNITFTGLKL